MPRYHARYRDQKALARAGNEFIHAMFGDGKPPQVVYPQETEMRRAARTDSNQHELVEALKKIGAKCYFIGKPVDLLVGFRNANMLLEVKRPDKRGQPSAITQEQKDFIATWPGQVAIVHTIDEAITAVVNLK